MFWGLVLEPGKRYTQTVERAFHVSMACLEANAIDTDIVSVVLEDQAKKQFILCNLHKHKVIQAQLDLNFQSGDVLSFSATGKGKVHLTGYLLEQDEDVEEEEGEEEASDSNDLSLEELENLKKDMKTGKRKKGTEGATPDLKKQKIEDLTADDSDESDEDYEVGAIDKESGEDVDGEDGEDGQDDDDEEDEDDEDDDEDEDEDDTVEEIEDDVIPQLNAESKKKEKQDKNKTPKQKSNAQNEKQDGKTPKTPQVNGNQLSSKKNKKGESSKSKSPMKKHLEGGVIIEETAVGNGPVAKRGKQVTVYYAGRLLQNNKLFDSSLQGTGFKFRLGRNEVIRGWEIGIAGMKVGGKRKITCPAAMAYGAKGSPPAIPPNSTLVFDVELRGVN